MGVWEVTRTVALETREGWHWREHVPPLSPQEGPSLQQHGRKGCRHKSNIAGIQLSFPRVQES